MAAQRTIVLPVEFHPVLEATLEEAHKAYRVISEAAFAKKVYTRYALQRLTYQEVKARTDLTAQMICSAIRKVSAAYRSMKANNRLPDEPARFDNRCIDLEGGSRGRDFRIYPEKGIVSISTSEGRKNSPIVAARFNGAISSRPNGRFGPRGSFTSAAVRGGVTSFT
jgi:hypothetical protein